MNIRSRIVAIFIVFVFWYGAQSATLRKEPDIIVDGMLVFGLLVCFLQDNNFLKNRMATLYFVFIVCCVKLAYYYDNS